MKQYNGEKAIISLTSWKARINTVCKTLFSLIDQCPGFHIVLVLSEEEFPKKEDELPENLKIFIDNDLIEIIWAEKNLRPHLKYFYTMQKYRSKPIITTDDDQLAMCNFAELLYKSYLSNKDMIHAGRMHRMKFYKGKIYNYKQWYWEIKDENPSLYNFPTGVGGVLYPPDILKISDNDINEINKILCQDDMFLKHKELEHKILCKYVSGISFKYINDTAINESALSNTNVKLNVNDKIIKEILQPHFNEEI